MLASATFAKFLFFFAYSILRMAVAESNPLGGEKREKGTRDKVSAFLFCALQFSKDLSMKKKTAKPRLGCFLSFPFRVSIHRGK